MTWRDHLIADAPDCDIEDEIVQPLFAFAMKVCAVVFGTSVLIALGLLVKGCA